MIESSGFQMYPFYFWDQILAQKMWCRFNVISIFPAVASYLWLFRNRHFWNILFQHPLTNHSCWRYAFPVTTILAIVSCCFVQVTQNLILFQTFFNTFAFVFFGRKSEDWQIKKMKMLIDLKIEWVLLIFYSIINGKGNIATYLLNFTTDLRKNWRQFMQLLPP